MLNLKCEILKMMTSFGQLHTMAWPDGLQLPSTSRSSLDPPAPAYSSPGFLPRARIQAWYDPMHKKEVSYNVSQYSAANLTLFTGQFLLVCICRSLV